MNLFCLFCLIATVQYANCVLVKSEIIYTEIGEKCEKNGIKSYEECKNNNETLWTENKDIKINNKKFSVISRLINGVKRVCRYNLKRHEEVCSSSPQCNATSYNYIIRTTANMEARTNVNTTCLNEYTENITDCDKDCGIGKQIIGRFCESKVNGKTHFSCSIVVLPCNEVPCFQWSEWESVCYKRCPTPNKIFPVQSRHCLHHTGKIVSDTKCAILGDNEAIKNGTCRFLSRPSITRCDLDITVSSTTIRTKGAKSTIKIFNDVPPDPSTTKRTRERSTDENKIKSEKTEDKSNLIWVWVIVAVVIFVALVVLVILVLKKRNFKFTRLKAIAGPGIFQEPNSETTITIQATESPGKNCGYWTLKDTEQNRKSSVKTNNTINASCSSIYENEDMDSENIYATIESVKRKRKAPRPPEQDTAEENDTREDVITEDGKIIRGGDIYSTINKKKRAALQARSDEAMSINKDRESTLDEDYVNIEHSEKDKTRNNSLINDNIEDNGNIIIDKSINAKDESVYFIPPDAV